MLSRIIPLQLRFDCFVSSRGAEETALGSWRYARGLACLREYVRFGLLADATPVSRAQVRLNGAEDDWLFPYSIYNLTSIRMSIERHVLRSLK